MSENMDGEDLAVRYVQVPVVEEKILYIPRREIREVEKKVPKIKVVEVVKCVEVPQVQYIDRHVEVGLTSR